MELIDFAKKVESEFQENFPMLQVEYNVGTSLLEMEDKNTQEICPAVDIKELFEKTNGKLDVENVCEKIIAAYDLKIKNENIYEKFENEVVDDEILELTLEDVYFLALNKEDNLSEQYLHIDKGEMILQFCYQDGDDFAYIPEYLMVEYGWDMKAVYAHAVQNMRNKYPCKCIPLQEHMQNNPDVILSLPATEQIFVLVCENADFPYASSGLYYSAKEIKELSDNLGCELYIFQCGMGDTFLCPVNVFSREEAAEIMESVVKDNESRYAAETLLYSHGAINALSENTMKMTRNHGRSI